MHTVRQLAGSGIDGQSMVRQAVPAPRSTPVIPVISPIGARIGRATRPTSATTTRATLRIPSEPTGPGESHPVESTSRRRHRRRIRDQATQAQRLAKEQDDALKRLAAQQASAQAIG